MAAPTDHYLYGAGTLALESFDIRERRYGIDIASASFVSASVSDARPGTVLPISGYSGFIIQDSSHSQVGNLWRHRVECEGFMSGKTAQQLPGYPQVTGNLAEFDQVQDKWLTSNKGLFTEGQYGSYGGTMVCTAASSSRLFGAWYEVTGTFTGIIRPKPYTRVITVNGDSWSGDAVVVNLENGWSTPQKAQINFPKIVVKDTYITTSRAPTGNVPASVTPPNAPSVRVIPGTTTSPLYHWPNGWVLIAVDQQEVANAVFRYTLTYEYQNRITFG